MALSLAQKFVNLGMASPLAVEYANQLNENVYNWRRLAELGMVPILAKYVAESLAAGTFIGRVAMEKSMTEAIANLTTNGGWDGSARNRLMAGLGDSFEAQNLGVVAGGYQQHDERGDAAWIAFLSRQRVFAPPLYSKGIGGQRIDEIVGRFASDILTLNPLPGFLSLGSGAANSISQNKTLSQIMDGDGGPNGINALVALCRANRIVLIIETPSPNNLGWTAPQQAVLASYLTAVRALHNPPYVRVSDHYNDMAVSTDSYAAKTDMVKPDFLHPTSRGSYYRGKRKAEQIIAALPASNEPWDTDGPTLNTNPIETGTNGTKANGVTNAATAGSVVGGVSSNWTATASATLTGDQVITAGKYTDGGGSVWQEFTVTGTWAGSGNLTFNTTMANFGTAFAIGDIVSHAMDYELLATDGIRAINAQVVYANGSPVAEALMGDTGFGCNEPHTGISRLVRFTFPVGSTRCTPGFEVSWAAGVINLKWRVRRSHLIKLAS